MSKARFLLQKKEYEESWVTFPDRKIRFFPNSNSQFRENEDGNNNNNNNIGGTSIS